MIDDLAPHAVQLKLLDILAHCPLALRQVKPIHQGLCSIEAGDVLLSKHIRHGGPSIRWVVSLICRLEVVLPKDLGWPAKHGLCKLYAHIVVHPLQLEVRLQGRKPLGEVSWVARPVKD